MTNSLYRENVTPRPKLRAVKSCNRPLCSATNPCVSCRNSNSRTKGLKAQRKAAKAMGVRPRFRSQLGNEENYRDPHFRYEHKHGEQVMPIFTRYAEVEAQADKHRAVGDIRGLIFTCSIDGVGDELVIMRCSTWARDIAPLLVDDT